jgi:hypothetical protein
MGHGRLSAMARGISIGYVCDHCGHAWTSQIILGEWSGHDKDVAHEALSEFAQKVGWDVCPKCGRKDSLRKTPGGVKTEP